MSSFATAVRIEIEEERKMNMMRILNEKDELSLSEWGVEDLRLALFFKLCRGLEHSKLQEMFGNIVKEAEKREIPEQELQGYVDLFLLAFQTRDIDEGKGERQLFYWMLLELYGVFPKTTLELLPLIPAKYGSWKDMVTLLEMTEKEEKYKVMQDRIFKMFMTQLQEDKQVYYRKIRTTENIDKEVEVVSLCAKWAPREGRHYSWFSKRLAIMMFKEEPDLYPNGSLRTESVKEVETKIKKTQNLEEKKVLQQDLKKSKQSCYKRYRQTVAQLNKYLNTTEVLMCDKEGKWSNLVPGHIPAKCLKIHRKAFLNKTKNGEIRSDKQDRLQCATNFQTHLEKALRDPTSARVHGKNLMPHEIVTHYFKDRRKEDLTLEAQWVDLRERLKESGTLGNFVSMVDTSGSMTGTPMMVAIALGILISECCQPAFRDMFLTFSAEPEWHLLPKNARLIEKIQIGSNTKWGSNTDFQKALQKVLDVCVKNRIPTEEVESLTLAVFSDMQFDTASQTDNKYYGRQKENTVVTFETKYQKIAQAFKNAGYFNQETGEPIVPRILFWNLRGDTVDFPSNANTPGVDMVSGFSANGLKAFMDGDITKTERPTPYQTMRKQLDTERYDAVREICQETKEIKSKNTGQRYIQTGLEEKSQEIDTEIEEMEKQLQELRKQKTQLQK